MRRPVGLLRWAPAWIDALPAVTEDGDAEHYGLLIEVVEGLPETQLLVINGLYWEQVSQGKLALRLGVSQQAVGRRHARALASIRRKLNGGLR
jgi:DNA-directed RNA polymerase specialized sigma subunit